MSQYAAILIAIGAGLIAGWIIANLLICLWLEWEERREKR